MIIPLDPLHCPKVRVSVTKFPLRFPDPKKMLAYWSVVLKVEDLESSNDLYFGAPISVLEFKIQVLVEPVSNKALMVYGGVPTVISVIYALSYKFYKSELAFLAFTGQVLSPVDSHWTRSLKLDLFLLTFFSWRENPFCFVCFSLIASVDPKRARTANDYKNFI